MGQRIRNQNIFRVCFFFFFSNPVIKLERTGDPGGGAGGGVGVLWPFSRKRMCVEGMSPRFAPSGAGRIFTVLAESALETLEGRILKGFPSFFVRSPAPRLTLQLDAKKSPLALLASNMLADREARTLALVQTSSVASNGGGTGGAGGGAGVTRTPSRALKLSTSAWKTSRVSVSTPNPARIRKNREAAAAEEEGAAGAAAGGFGGEVRIPGTERHLPAIHAQDRQPAQAPAPRPVLQEACCLRPGAARMARTTRRTPRRAAAVAAPRAPGAPRPKGGPRAGHGRISCGGGINVDVNQHSDGGPGGKAPVARLRRLIRLRLQLRPSAPTSSSVLGFLGCGACVALQAGPNSVPSASCGMTYPGSLAGVTPATSAPVPATRRGARPHQAGQPSGGSAGGGRGGFSGLVASPPARAPWPERHRRP